MAGHANIKTTDLYDRRDDDVSFSERDLRTKTVDNDLSRAIVPRYS